VFQIVNAGAALPKLPGVYQFLKRSPQGEYESLYVGRAQDLANRQSQHMANGMSDWYKALSLGMTHVGYLAELGSEWDRYQLENDIYETYRPELNNIAPARPDNELANALRGLVR
jgi:excinuclease UvrABC nuclease subunit